MTRVVAACTAGAILLGPTFARADDTTATGDQPQQDAAAAAAARAKAECAEDLKLAEDAVERDYKYARNWTDAWYVVGAGLMGLAVTSAFQYHDYRRGEQLVNAFQSLLLVIQVPTATSSGRALRGIRTAAQEDPCLALANTRFIFEANYDDWKQHTQPINYVIAGAIPIIGGLLVGLSTQHWDFAGHGAEGLGTLVGLVAGELQVVTYPRGSVKVTGNSLTMTF